MNLMDEVTRILIQIYKVLPVGRDKIYAIAHAQHPNISRPMVQRFLANLEVHQLHRPNKLYSSSSNVIISKRPLERFHVDLIYVDKMKGYNDQVEYLLTVIDHFSHKVWVRPLLNRL